MKITKKIRHLLKKTIANSFKTNKKLEIKDCRDAKSLILIRPNYRIGNTVISASIMRTIKQAFPEAHIDYLGTDSTACVMENMGISQQFHLSRKHILFPWKLILLINRLRKNNYDVAIDLGMGSFSSGLISAIIKPKVLIGEKNWTNDILNVAIPTTKKNVYEKRHEFAEAFGHSKDSGPYYNTSVSEQTEASIWLKNNMPEAFIGLFVGGHTKKRWSQEKWINLVQELSRAHINTVVFTGPEEVKLTINIKNMNLEHITVAPLMPIRKMAAICEQAKLVVTPDTGPMHLAVALGRPVIAILQVKKSQPYAPTGVQHRSLMKPEVSNVMESILSHPAVPIMNSLHN